MYVDEENPLFMIRNCPIWGGPQTGEAFAEYAIKTYYALPEDVRNFVAHTYAIINESKEKIEIDLCNLRLDADAVCNWLEDENQFMIDYANGGKMNNPNDFRTSVITLSGFDAPPSVNAWGSNGAKGWAEWNEETKALTLTDISNSEVRIMVG